MFLTGMRGAVGRDPTAKHDSRINPKRSLFGLASQSPGWEPKKIPPHSACDIGSGICLEMVMLGLLKNIKV